MTAPDPSRGEGMLEETGHSLTTSAGVLRFWTRGAGPPLILLHGLGTTHRSFEGILPYLTRKHSVLAVDLLGHGGSDPAAADLSVPAQAQAMVDLMSELHIQQVAIIGHSLGGSIAIRVAATEPGRIRKLVLLAAGSYDFALPFGWSLVRSRFLWRLLGLLFRGRILRRFQTRSRKAPPSLEVPSDHSRDSHSPPAPTGARWAALGRAVRQNLSQETLSEMEDLVEHALRHPTLVIWGSDDRVNSVAAARVLFREKRNVRFIEIAGGSHTVHEEHPEIVKDLILEFLE